MTILATMDGQRKFGRKRPVAHGPMLRMSRYMRGNLPAPPSSVDYSPAARASLTRIFMNDQLGDCVPAAVAHLIGVFTGNAGDLITLTDSEVVALYSAMGGYRPGHPETDQGCDEVTALNVWHQHGALNEAHRIAGWLAVDANNVTEVKQALYLFENLVFGIELPDAWTQVQESGFVWDVGTPNPSNGHCVAGVGFDDRGIQISTWGMVGTMTYPALARNVGNRASGGELYAVISQDAIAKASQKSPGGFSWAQLVADFDAIGGHVPLPAPMPPVPVPPTPVPVMTGVTKAQVLAAVDLAINGLPWK